MTMSSFSYSDDLKHEILLQADYPDPAEAHSDLDHYISQDLASIRDRASINYFALQTLASKRDRASIQTRPLYR